MGRTGFALALCACAMCAMTPSAASSEAAGARFAVASVAVEHLRLPPASPLLGVDIACPRVSWVLAPLDSTDRGVAQSSYRVTVAVASGSATVWDSGKVASNTTMLMQCCCGDAGGPSATTVLQSDTLYNVTVATWDDTGAAAAVATGQFRSALLNRSDWGDAAWITPGLGRNLLRSPTLRVPSPVAEATVYVSGVGFFELSCNGRAVSPGRKFDVAWTSYAQRVNYVAFDLAPCLVVGDNVLGVKLGNSWFQERGWYQLPPYVYGPNAQGQMVTGCTTAGGGGTCNGGGFSYPNPNQLLLLARVRLAAGADADAGGAPLLAPPPLLTLSTGTPGWQAGAGPITFDSIYDGEFYDARLEQPGWDAPGFAPPQTALASAAPWAPASPASSVVNNATLSAQLTEPIRVVEERPPVASWASPSGGGDAFVFDFGVNMVGVVRLRVASPTRGANVTLRHAEVLLHPPFGPRDGSLYYGSLRNAKATDVYTMKGVPGETYEPTFTSHGFRYVEVSGLGYAPDDGDVTMLVTHNDVSSSSSFSVNADAGANVINLIARGCRTSIAGNLFHGPGSCAARDERQFFTGDTALAAEASLLSFDVAAIYTHWLQTAADGQRPDGAIGDYAPDTVGDARDGHANWATGFMTAAWLLHRMHGDVTAAARHVGALERYVAFNEGKYNASGGMAKYWPVCVCEWVNIGANPNASLVNGVGYLHDLAMFADLASALGLASAAGYRERFNARLAEFHRVFYSPSAGTYGQGTQTELAMALWIGAPPNASVRARAAAALAAKIERVVGGATDDFVGGVGVRYLFEALSLSDHADTALRLALKTDFPSYGWMFFNPSEPSTTMWELWDSDKGDPTMDSRNHIFSASVATFFYKVLAGVTAAAPGYEQARVAPVNLPVGDPLAANLTTAAADVNTPHGTLRVEWTTVPPSEPVGNATCAVVEEARGGPCGVGPHCAHVGLACGPGGGNISRVVFASFESAGADVGSCSTGLHSAGACEPGGSKRMPTPNATAIVAGMCLGKPSCSVPVDFQIFGNPCNGVKKLAVAVACDGRRPPPKGARVFRQAVAVPVGVTVELALPLRGVSASLATVTEGGRAVWRVGAAVLPLPPGVSGLGVDAGGSGTLGALLAQGSYVFEVFAPPPSLIES